MARTFVAWNPSAGRARQAAEIRRRLSRQSQTVVCETGSADDATRQVTQAIDDGCELIVAAGGDGTVNAVANGIVRASGDARMAILPIGTANDFALTLALPDDLEAASELISSGVYRPIDLVELETATQQRCFANIAAGGNSDRITESLTDEIKETWGPFCYLRGAVAVLVDLESYEVAIHFEEGPALQVKVWNLLIGNGRTNAGHLPVAPRANPEDGLLDVILIQDGHWGDLAALSTRLVLGDYLESDQVIYRQVRSLRMVSKPPMRFSIDGEPIDEQPVAFRVKPGAVRMIVGPDYVADPTA